MTIKLVFTVTFVYLSEYYIIGDVYMTPLGLTSSITAIANAIACNTPDDDALSLLGAIFTQLGDTLSTISIQRDICDKINQDNNQTTDDSDS